MASAGTWAGGIFMSTYNVVTSVAALVTFVSIIVELKSVRAGRKKVAVIAAVVGFLAVVTWGSVTAGHTFDVLFGKTR
jgi:hypothetical protein